MPIYEFSCKSCGEVMEVLQKMSDPYPNECEHCGLGPLEKQISQTSKCGSLTNSQAEYESATLANAKPLSEPRRESLVKDKDGHYVEKETEESA